MKIAAALLFVAVSLAVVAISPGRRLTQTHISSDHEREATVAGRFELIELKSLEEFRAVYLTVPALYLGHDSDWEYLALIGSDRVHKVSREIADRQALQRLQAERSKLKFVPGGPPMEHRRSKEFLDWLEKTKPVRD